MVYEAPSFFSFDFNPLYPLVKRIEEMDKAIDLNISAVYTAPKKV
jgi:hypothetical protein